MGNRFIARHLKLANDSFGRVNDHEGILARRIATPKSAQGTHAAGVLLLNREHAGGMRTTPNMRGH